MAKKAINTGLSRRARDNAALKPAEAMAVGACRVLGCDVSIAVTGVAGPERQEGVPVGTVWVATSVDGVAESAVGVVEVFPLGDGAFGVDGRAGVHPWVDRVLDREERRPRCRQLLLAHREGPPRADRAPR